jgi:hypothetical protein
MRPRIGYRYDFSSGDSLRFILGRHARRVGTSRVEVLGMAVDDYFETEVGIAVAATAALLSPKARRVLRRGLVYGTAGALAAGEVLASAGRRVGGAASELVTPGEQEAAQEPPPAAKGRSRSRTIETTA